ncbi:MAG: cytochrome C oxidase Cbb3, partial [Bacteroidota bacterium]
MKINWGTGIVIAFVCFISFIIFFVVRSHTDNRADHDLVTED